MTKTRTQPALVREGGERIATLFAVLVVALVVVSSALAAPRQGDRLLPLVPRQVAMYAHASGAGLERFASFLPATAASADIREASAFAVRRDDGGLDFGYIVLVSRRSVGDLSCAATTVLDRRSTACLFADDTVVSRLQRASSVDWSLADDREARRSLSAVRRASATQVFLRPEWWSAPGVQGAPSSMVGTWDAPGTWRLVPAAVAAKPSLSFQLPSGQDALVGTRPDWAETTTVGADSHVAWAAAQVIFGVEDPERQAGLAEAVTSLRASLLRIDHFSVGRQDAGRRPFLAHFRRVSSEQLEREVTLFHSSAQKVHEETVMPDGERYTEIITGGDWLAFVENQAGDKTLVSFRPEVNVPSLTIRSDGEGGFWISDKLANFAFSKNQSVRSGKIICGEFDGSNLPSHEFGLWLDGRVCLHEYVDKSVVIYKE